jgi:hypothetical protein
MCLPLRQFIAVKATNSSASDAVQNGAGHERCGRLTQHRMHEVNDAQTSIALRWFRELDKAERTFFELSISSKSVTP